MILNYFFLVVFASYSVAVNKDYVVGGILPLPQSQTPSQDLFNLDPEDFKFTATGETSDVLEAAFERYFNLTFPREESKGAQNKKPEITEYHGKITSLNVNVKEKYSDLSLESDESYTLDVVSPTADLRANTVWGALRGLETFSQVVIKDRQNNFFTRGNKIDDFPRFHYRGFLIDTSRHYINIPTIMKHMEAMSYSKMNVLHWHIVDDQSFPFVSTTFPSLSGQGAYDNVTHIFSPDDVNIILEYGRLLGIRVIPEFDSPGHAKAFKSIPNLLTPCYKDGKPTEYYGPFNPTLETTYEFLTKFFTEISEKFWDHYIHLGGDEVDCSCWMIHPQILAWMEEHNITTCNLLQQYYEQRLLDIVDNLKKGNIVWQEIFDNEVKVHRDTVIQVWKAGWRGSMAKVTGAGYRVILSACWYLNYISYGVDWKKYYKCDPTDFTGTDEQKKLVVGGTACMWSEFVDATNLLSRSWPRAMTVAEKLWSSKQATASMNNFSDRLHEHRCRYLMRGIPAEGVHKSGFCHFEWPGN